MDNKHIMMVLILGLVFVSAAAGVYAREDEECECGVRAPAGDLGVAAITEGAGFIMAGGPGPLIILALAFVIGMIVSHLIWGGF